MRSSLQKYGPIRNIDIKCNLLIFFSLSCRTVIIALFVQLPIDHQGHSDALVTMCDVRDARDAVRASKKLYICGAYPALTIEQFSVNNEKVADCDESEDADFVNELYIASAPTVTTCLFFFGFSVQ